jgi:hypothetical protein
MNNVIDFVRERAIRKSGIKDKSVIDYMIDNQLDPCDADDVAVYVLQMQLIDVFGDVDIDNISIPLTTVNTTQDYIFCPDFSLFFDPANK